MKTKYSTLLEGQDALTAFGQYEFDPDVVMRLARLTRWGSQQFSDYAKVRTKLEQRHAKKDDSGAMVPVQQPVVGEDGVTRMQDVPNTFTIKDAKAWERDTTLLGNGEVDFPVDDRITEADITKVRSAHAEKDGMLAPWIVAGLGPFFNWGDDDQPTDPSVADMIWKLIDEPVPTPDEGSAVTP